MTYDVSSSTTFELLSTFRRIIRELRDRGVIRTDNAPTGDFAEYLIAAYTEGELAPNSEKSWDVRSRTGELIQVKARVSPEGGGAGTRQLSVIRSWDFDRLAVVLFDDDYSIRHAWLIPTAIARDAATYIQHVNGYRVIATGRLTEHPEVEDISGALRLLTSRI